MKHSPAASSLRKSASNTSPSNSSTTKGGLFFHSNRGDGGGGGGDKQVCEGDAKEADASERTGLLQAASGRSSSPSYYTSSLSSRGTLFASSDRSATATATANTSPMIATVPVAGRTIPLAGGGDSWSISGAGSGTAQQQQTNYSHQDSRRTTSTGSTDITSNKPKWNYNNYQSSSNKSDDTAINESGNDTQTLIPSKNDTNKSGRHHTDPPQSKLSTGYGSSDNDDKRGNYKNNNTTKKKKRSSSTPEKQQQNTTEGGKDGPLLVIIYGLINTIMCVPCLYGYASVIFNHAIFQNDINALSKLVLFSSIVHMVCFSLWSSLPFSVGQVQDAGLIFLSAMANTIANTMLSNSDDNNNNLVDVEAIVSTTIVLLGLCTACLGLILVVMGKYRLADLVSYLPLPVVGGYLAFIGYFCLEAGVALCIDKSMMNLRDWFYLTQPQLLLLATPGLLGGLLIMYLARNATSDAALPMAMVGLPLAFYMIVLMWPNMSMSKARDAGWLGPESPPIPAQDVFGLIHLSKVDWSLIPKILPTWAGMVFVVSFSSCLDVAAISMDMGEALDVNNELMTVGISNFVSGLFCGFTGSYIFSQTIFTYRTGCRTRWIGIFLIFSELSVFLITINVLEVTPLFFLGATLIYIGFDLLYEWLWEVRHKLLLSEYLVLLATFVAIHVVGIDFGILVGLVFAALDYVVTTAKSSSLIRVTKRSRAVWNPKQYELLQNVGYSTTNPKIITLELKGSVFFGSSLQLLTGMTNEINVKTTQQDRDEMRDVMASPMHCRSPAITGVSASPAATAANLRRRRSRSSSVSNQAPLPPSPLLHAPPPPGGMAPSTGRGRPSSVETRRRLSERQRTRSNENLGKYLKSAKKDEEEGGDGQGSTEEEVDVVRQRLSTPDFVVLDLHQMQNLDASASRGCFLQFVKMCGKRGVVVCGAGASPRIDWMLKKHDVAFDNEQEQINVMRTLLGEQPDNDDTTNDDDSSTGTGAGVQTSHTAALDLSHMILLETTDEALEFCETCLIERMSHDLDGNNSKTFFMSRPRSFLNLSSSEHDIDHISPSSHGVSGGLLSTFTLSAVFQQYLGLDEMETKLLDDFELCHTKAERYHEELTLMSGDVIFKEHDTPSDAFYIVLKGSVALHQKYHTRSLDGNTHNHHQRPAKRFLRLKQQQHNNSQRTMVTTTLHSTSTRSQLGDGNNLQQQNSNKILSGAGMLSHSMKQHSFAEKMMKPNSSHKGLLVDSGTSTSSKAANVLADSSTVDTLGPIKKYVQLGAIFGFVDYILKQPRTFGAVCTVNHTIVAKLHRQGLERLKANNPKLERIVEKVLLQASIRELANVMEP